MKKTRFTKTGIYSFGIVFLLAWLVLYVWRTGVDLTYNLSDIPYHLAVSSGYARAGGVVTWDFWESLPLGRVHNYPPLFHIIFSNFVKLGLSQVVIVKLMMEFTIVGGFLIYIWGVVKLFNVKVAFWSFFITVSSLFFIHLSATVMPATLTVFCVPVLFYSLRQKKWFSYTIILIFLFYLHLFLPYVILLGFLIYLLAFRREELKSWSVATAIAFLCYLPWFAHVLVNGFSYIKYFDGSYSLSELQNTTHINLTIFFLSIVGLFYFIKNNSNKASAEKFIWVMITVFLVLSSLMANRIANGNLLLLASLPVGILLTRSYENKFLKYVIIALVLSCACNSFYFVARGSNSKITIHQSSFLSSLFVDEESLFSPTEYITIGDKISKVTEPGDSIISMVSIYDDMEANKSAQKGIANYWAVSSDLAVINLRQPEIYHRPEPDVNKAKILLTSTVLSDINSELLDPYGYVANAETVSQLQNNFVLLSEYQRSTGENVYFYINKSPDTIRGSVPGAKVPLVVADIFIALLFLLLLRDLKQPIQSKLVDQSVS